MKKTIQLTFLVILTFASYMAQSQTPQWVRDGIVSVADGDGHAITTDATGNTYTVFRNMSNGELFVAKLDPSGTLLWSDNIDASDEVNIGGIEIAGGRLFIGFDSQTVTNGQQDPSIIEYNPATGAIIAGKAYVHTGMNADGHETTDMAIQTNGTDLILLCKDVMLHIDVSDFSIQSQWRAGADPTLTLTTTDLATYFGTSPDFTGTSANPTSSMPFFTGSPLANTQAPTDADNYTFAAETSFTFGVTIAPNFDAVNPIPLPTTGTTPYTGATSITNRAVVQTSEGTYIYSTQQDAGFNDQQVLTKFSSSDIYTVEWSQTWRQGAERGSIITDENNNVYVYTWDQLYFFGGALDLFANKFDKDGNYQWSKLYGSGNGGNEVNWHASTVAIDKTNQEIVLSLYTDSYNSNNPSALLLSTNYDGNIQNYTFLSVSGEQRIPKSTALDGNGNAYVVFDDNGTSGAGVFKVNTATVFLAPTLASATKDSDTQITVTFSENVQTNEGNPTDFTVTDGVGSTFAVSGQADGTMGDTDIVLTVASLTAAIGDLTVTYTNANNEISDTATGTKFTATDATGVVIDTDMSAPTLISGVRDSDTQLTITMSEPVQTNGTNPTDFVVKDANTTAFVVSTQADGTMKDTDIVLTVADFSGATGPLTVTYTNTNAEISDFGGNELATDATGVDISLLPEISGVSLAADNSYIDVTFSLGVYNTNGGSGMLEASDFGLGISGGSASAPSITSVTKNDNSPLAGGETVIRINFTVTDTPDGSEVLTVSPVSNQIFDAGGDAALTTQSNNTATMNDQVVPTVTNVTSTASSGNYKEGDVIPITVTFSEAVTVTGTPQIELETGTTDRTVDYTSGTTTTTLTFNYTVQAGDTNGGGLEYTSTSALTLNSGTIKDAAGNDATLTLATPGASGSISNTKSITIDTTSPTVTGVSSTSSSGNYKEGDVIPITVTFSEAVTVTGTPQIELETGTTDRTVDYTSGTTTTTLTFNYTVQAGDTNGGGLEYTSTSALTLNSGTIKDDVGNDATLTLATPGASGSISNTKSITIDTTSPTVTGVSSTSSSGNYKEGDVIPITVTFSEAVTVTGTPQIELETGTTDRTVDYTSGTTTTTLTFNYTVQAGDTNGGGLEYTSTSALTLNSGTVKDDAGNDATLTLATPGASGSISNTKSITIDTTSPTFSNLGGTSTFTLGAIEAGLTDIPYLDQDVTITDVELDALDDYQGASITVSKNGTGSANDDFRISGNYFQDGSGGVEHFSSGVVASYNDGTAGSFTVTFDQSITKSEAIEIIQGLGYYDKAGPSTQTIDYTFNDASGNSATGSVSVETINPTWEGTTDSDWGVASNWSGNFVPGSSDDVEVPDVTNDPIITTSVEVNSIDIQTGAVLTVSSNSLKVNNATTLDGSLSVASEASFVPLGSISGAGSATINRNTTFGTSAGRYSAIGSPVTMGSTSSLGSIVYSYDETVAYDPGGTDGSARFVSVASPETMTVGDAYFSANTGNIAFTGTPNSGNIDVSLVYDESNDGGSTNAGFNLVSNPYPAAISFTDFVNGNSDIDGAIYVWDDGGSESMARTNSDYIVATTMGISGGSGRVGSADGFMRSTQGFFVKATSAGTLNFTPSMMATGNNSDAGYFRKENPTVLRIAISTDKAYNDILIGFSEDATVGFDRTLDAYKFKGNSALQISSKMEAANMAIQALPIVSEETTVKLSFDAAESSIYTLELKDASAYGFGVYLKDNQLNKLVDLSENGTYKFQSSAVTNSDRFSLVFSPNQILSIDDQLNSEQLVVFSNKDLLTIRLEQTLSDATVKIYDLSGSVVRQFRQVDFAGADWNTSFNQEGLFIVTIQAQGKLLVKKFSK